MPYSSDKQRRYMNSQAGKKVPRKVVEEFNRESKGKKRKKKKVNMMARGDLMGRSSGDRGYL